MKLIMSDEAQVAYENGTLALNELEGSPGIYLLEGAVDIVEKDGEWIVHTGIRLETSKVENIVEFILINRYEVEDDEEPLGYIYNDDAVKAVYEEGEITYKIIPIPSHDNAIFPVVVLIPMITPSASLILQGESQPTLSNEN